MSGLDGRLQKVVAYGKFHSIAIWLTEEPIGILVRWSPLREVVAQGGSTVTSAATDFVRIWLTYESLASWEISEPEISGIITITVPN